ncbi:MAG: hypothetical protein WCC17_22465 [Candidatus Nitrosopolaris sp.]
MEKDLESQKTRAKLLEITDELDLKHWGIRDSYTFLKEVISTMVSGQTDTIYLTNLKDLC